MSAAGTPETSATTDMNAAGRRMTLAKEHGIFQNNPNASNALQSEADDFASFQNVQRALAAAKCAAQGSDDLQIEQPSPSAAQPPTEDYGVLQMKIPSLTPAQLSAGYSDDSSACESDPEVGEIQVLAEDCSVPEKKKKKKRAHKSSKKAGTNNDWNNDWNKQDVLAMRRQNGEGIDSQMLLGRRVEEPEEPEESGDEATAEGSAQQKTRVRRELEPLEEPAVREAIVLGPSGRQMTLAFEAGEFQNEPSESNADMLHTKSPRGV